MTDLGQVTFNAKKEAMANYFPKNVAKKISGTGQAITRSYTDLKVLLYKLISPNKLIKAMVKQ